MKGEQLSQALNLDEQGRPSCRSQLDPITVRIPEAMRLTGIGRSKLYELMAANEIEIAKVGTCTLVTVASLRRLIDRTRR